MTTEDPSPTWEPIRRAWLMIKIENVSRVKLAKDILERVNDKYEAEEKVFAVRADVVSGPYDLIIPVYTECLEQLDEMVAFIKEIDGVQELETALVIRHVPKTPHTAQGFVTYQEANPLPRGPIDKENGHNPW